MIDYGNGMIFPDSWAYGPPDPPERPECPNCGGDPTQDVETGEDPCLCGVTVQDARMKADQHDWELSGGGGGWEVWTCSKCGHWRIPFIAWLWRPWDLWRRCGNA